LFRLLQAIRPHNIHSGRTQNPRSFDPNRSEWPDHILNVWYGGEFLRGLHMVVTERYKYVFNSFAWDELYDLNEDPEEIANFIDDPGYAAVVDDMRARLYELMEELGDPYGDPCPKFDMPDYGKPNRYCSPRYLPRGKRSNIQTT